VASDDAVKAPEATRPLEALFQEHARGLSGAIRSILGRNADVGEVLQQAFLQALRWERRGRRAGDAVALSGYMGDDNEFDKAIAEFAGRYADQTQQDWRALLDAIAAGRISAEPSRELA